MKISFSKHFKKNFQSRIKPFPKLLAKFESRLELFVKDRKSHLLRDHRLVGKKNYFRSFSVSGDIRVIYAEERDEIILIDIGSHNQVYS